MGRFECLCVHRHVGVHGINPHRGVITQGHFENLGVKLQGVLGISASLFLSHVSVTQASVTQAASLSHAR